QKALMESTRLEMQAELGKTQELATLVDRERATYQQLRNEKASVLSSINKDVRRLEAAYREIEQSSQEIEWFLANLRGGGSPTFGGTFVNPLPGHRIGSGFGYRHHPILKRRKMHTGIDIPAPAKTPIRAAAAGTVVFAGWKNGYGKCVIINHGRGFATLYGHMSVIKVTNGQQLSQGAVIGGVGTTGMSTGNHLHFEVRVNGKPVNPRGYI
ncbi:MAG TPA: M23 family metallopeptidase, partial [bacterium]|nr:M23 family metallopeptidase [bacterium]